MIRTYGQTLTQTELVGAGTGELMGGYLKLGGSSILVFNQGRDVHG